jgi:hypothetical protein
MSMSFEQVASVLSPYIIGAAGGVGGVLLTGFGKEFFDKRDRKEKHKINVAREVHKVCVEADTSFYHKYARDPEHVTSVIDDVKSVDKDMGVKFEHFVTMWNGIALFIDENKSNTTTFIERRDKMVKKIREFREEIVEWEGRIRAGR